MAGPNIGYATLSVIPSLRGAKSTLTDGIVGPAREVGRDSGDKMGSSMLGSLGSALKFGALGVGAAAGAIVVKGFFEALDQGKAEDKVAASFGLDPATATRVGDIAGRLYADAYGESFSQVVETVGSVRQALGDLGDDELADLSTKALDFATAFDQDVQSAIGAASFLVRNGLVKDADEAFDILTVGMQRLPVTVRDELLEATQEYGTFFADLGITGTEAFAIIAAAAEKGGQFGVDKVGDALKEFTIRATDASTLTQSAFDTINVNMQDSAEAILAGGETARAAFDEIITGLLSVEDPVARSNAAIALFGTPLEDLSVNEIPAFLTGLSNMQTGLGDTSGAAETLGTTLNDNTATSIEEFKRGAMQGLVDFMEDTVIPEVEELGRVFREEGFAGALDYIVDDRLPQWLDDLDTWFDEEGKQAFLDLGGSLGKALGQGLWEGVKDEFSESWDFLSQGEWGIDLPDLPSVPMPDLPGLAHGGPVKAGRGYFVGDRFGVSSPSTELFVPESDGWVMPNVSDYSNASSSGGWSSLVAGDLIVQQMPGEDAGEAAYRELNRLRVVAGSP